MITYSEAEAKVRRSRSGTPKLQHNTYLYKRGDDYAVKFHYTDVVTIHRDGTYTLNSGGWTTQTTSARINTYGPARVYTGEYTHKGVGWCVHHSTDPKTPEKWQKCRACDHGTVHVARQVQEYGWRDYPTYTTDANFAFNTHKDGKVWAHLYSTAGDPLMRDGVPLTDQPAGLTVAGQVTRHGPGYGKLREPIVTPAHDVQCGRCDGTGRRDYGSKPNPVIFYDGIRVDSTGMVVDPGARRAYESPEEKAARIERARLAAERDRRRARRLALAENRRERTRFITQYALQETSPGKIIVFKAVDGNFRSGFNPRDGRERMQYTPGTTLTAPDWLPGAYCGGGLHFGGTPEIAESYLSTKLAAHFLACEVDVQRMYVIGDKCKARSARVLYEVDRDGNRIEE